MEKLRALIADDEAPARNKMMRLLQEVGGVDVVNVSTNGLDALTNMELLNPDVAFLDIEMPGMTGLDVVRNMPRNLNTHVIFTTAYNEHAIQAFELNAVDYLLKPFNGDRLKQAVDKVGRTNPRTDALQDAVDEASELLDLPQLNKIPVATADRYKLIDFDEIVCIEVEDRQTNIYTMNKYYGMNQTLDSFEKRLPPQHFIRISRSCIVSVHAIKDIVLWFGNRYKIVLINDKEVVSSRERSKALKQLLKF